MLRQASQADRPRAHSSASGTQSSPAWPASAWSPPCCRGQGPRQPRRGTCSSDPQPGREGRIREATGQSRRLQTPGPPRPRAAAWQSPPNRGPLGAPELSRTPRTPQTWPTRRRTLLASGPWPGCRIQAHEWAWRLPSRRRGKGRTMSQVLGSTAVRAKHWRPGSGRGRRKGGLAEQRSRRGCRGASAGRKVSGAFLAAEFTAQSSHECRNRPAARGFGRPAGSHGGGHYASAAKRMPCLRTVALARAGARSCRASERSIQRATGRIQGRRPPKTKPSRITVSLASLHRRRA